MVKIAHDQADSAARPADSAGKSNFTGKFIIITLSLLIAGIGGFYLVRYLMFDYLVYDRPFKTLSGHQREVSALAFSPDGRTIASGSHDKTVKLWDAATGELKRTFDGYAQHVRAVAFSPDGRTIASGGNDRTLDLRDASTGEIRLTKNFDADVLTIAFSPDSRSVAVGSTGIYMFDAVNGNLRFSISTDNFYAHGLALSPDGKTLAGAIGWEVKLWDAATGDLIRTFAKVNAATSPIAFSPDGRTLAGGDMDGRIFLWDVAGGSLKQTLTNGNYQNSIVFLPDGRLVGGGVQHSKKTDRFDGEIKIWDAATGSQLGTFAKQRQHVSAIAFSPEAQMLAVGDDDGTINLWRWK